MLIKIGDTIFDPAEQPISVYLTEADKQNVQALGSERHFITGYPSGTDADQIDRWVSDFKSHVAAQENAQTS